MSTINRVSNTKLLIPQLGSHHVYRERLTDTLHSNIQKRLQVISTPAGYGKTTLLTDFVHSIDVPACWYSIDVEDEDPKILLEGILNSLNSCFANFGQMTASRLAVTSDITKDAPHLLTILSNEIKDKISDFLVLVFEDYHVIENSELAKNILNLLLEKTPENCHFIISSRTQVELPAISKLILRNQVSILKMSHLSFSASEAKCLAATCFGKNLTSEDAARLVEETGGWVISLMLHLNNTDQNGSCKLLEITQDQVFRYMTAEVFEKQSQEIQDFLLASSTIIDMDYELIEQLIPNVNYHKMMSYLARQNLFLQCVDEKTRHYRYHQLFRDFLQEKFRQDDSTQFKLLHFKAALLYERERQLLEAVTHYQSARRYHEITRLIKENGSDLLQSGKWTIMQRCLKVLPLNLNITDPELVLLNAQCLIHLGNIDDAQKLLTSLLNKPLGNKDWLLKAEALSWRSAVFSLGGYFRKAKSDVSAAIRLLEAHQGPAELLGTCHRRLGDIYKDQGQFFSALKHLRLAQRCYTSVFNIGELALVHNSLGVIYKRLGQLTKAKMHFEKAKVGWTKINNLGQLAATLNNIGIIHQRFGQYDLALDAFHSGFEKARETGYLRAEAAIKISIADALRELSRFDDALKAYDEGSNLARQSSEATFIAYATAGVGETFRLLGQYDRARVLLEEARYQTEDQKQPYETSLFDIQLGIIAYETGHFEQAKTVLNDAYKRLQSMGDRDAMAKTCFHLAQVSFLAREYNIAAEWLEKASDLADELGYENFLVVEGGKALPLVNHGITLEIGNGRFNRILEKIKAFSETKQLECAVDAPKAPDLKNEYDVKAQALGVTEVTVNNRQITDTDWRSNRAKEIFFYLLTHPSGKTKEQISTALWPDLSPAKGSSNFHINLFRARQALFPGIFILEGGKYKINSNLRVWFDVAEFEQSVILAGKNPPDKMENAALEHAIKLYTGPFLAEFYTEWVEERRRELENAYLKILSLLADIKVKKGNIIEAVTLLEKSIAIDPYQEDTYYRIMRLYLKGNNKPLALRMYQQYLNTLALEESDVSLEIRNLYHKLLVRKVTSNIQTS
jgi:ATP/maltotriose-dependent transcriptional regulator MalT/two-component SAPR family response regulator